VLEHLRTIRRSRPRRPILLVLSCLHEAYPQQQHPEPYPFTTDGEPLPTQPALPENLLRTMAEQRRRFEGLVDRVVPLDITPAEEGFTDVDYGGERLRQVLLEVLPDAVGQTLLQLDEATRGLQDIAARHALPHILGYSTLAATAGAVPIPFVDLVVISGIQSRMVYDLARLYGQPLTAQRFLEIAGTLGLGMIARQASREVIKLIPFFGTVLGSVAGGALAGASTFALGQAFCFYYRAVHQGHAPRPDELRHYYQQQLAQAQEVWSRMFKGPAPKPQAAEAGS
jgi:uncharacterized protein (DUF697 family)